ncbi:MAG: amidohydrolase family protein [Deltaproteobacteria bacterium]|nr:amidohydrolase family protein [Deltaproteobacteria bacterium]
MTSGTLIDAHVHVLGTGSNGSGCWLRLSGYHRLLALYILRELGLPSTLLKGGLDQVYVERLLQMLRGSLVSRAVLLAHEHVYDEAGRRIENFGSFFVPNRYVLELAKRHPEFLAGVSIHPARHDALDELDLCIEEGAALMKCLPNCQNIDCSNPRYKKFWERMAQAGLPLLAHTGGELSVPVYNKLYSDPERLRLPLECGVKVIAAHCATSSLFFDTDYTKNFATMLRQYPNLFGDNSGMQTPIRSRHFRRILEEDISSRLIHGSDFPIPISATWARLRGFLSRSQAKELNSNKNVLERDVLIKRAMGFPEGTFTRAAAVLRLPN